MLTLAERARPFLATRIRAQALRLDGQEAAAGLEPSLSTRRSRCRRTIASRTQRARGIRDVPHAGIEGLEGRVRHRAAVGREAMRRSRAAGSLRSPRKAPHRSRCCASMAAPSPRRCCSIRARPPTPGRPRSMRNSRSFSPGALLIDKMTDTLFASGIETIESCSPAGSFMAQLWTGRRMTVDCWSMSARAGRLGFLARRLARTRLRVRARAARPAARPVMAAAETEKSRRHAELSGRTPSQSHSAVVLPH